VTTNSASFRETLIEYSLVYRVYLFVVYLTKLPGIHKHVYEALYHLFLNFLTPKWNLVMAHLEMVGGTGGHVTWY
jgi:hypothetical protein